jgi:N-acetylmuramoyl-L-alanine amidase
VIAIQRLYLASEDDAKTGMLRLSDLRRAGLRTN